VARLRDHVAVALRRRDPPIFTASTDAVRLKAKTVRAVLLCAFVVAFARSSSHPAPTTEAMASPSGGRAPATRSVGTPAPAVGEMPPTPPSAVRARVVHVTDGDTVVLQGIEHGEVHRLTGGRKARFIGIDTPEVSGGVECYGALASSFTRTELDNAQVWIDFDVGKVDRFGRALIYLWRADGSFFNGRLVAEGFALQMTVPPNVRYADLFTRLAADAREHERGLWSACAVAGP
jgi:micrococcal nuclease